MNKYQVLASIAASISLSSCELPNHPELKIPVGGNLQSGSLQSADYSSPAKGAMILFAKVPGQPTAEELKLFKTYQVRVLSSGERLGSGATIYNQERPSVAYVFVEQSIPEHSIYYAKLFGENLTPKIKGEIMKQNETAHLILHDAPGINFLNDREFPNFQLDQITLEGLSIQNKMELSEFLSDVASVTYNRFDLVRILKNSVSENNSTKNYQLSNNFLLSKLDSYFSSIGQEQQYQTLLTKLKDENDLGKKSDYLYEMLDLIGEKGAIFIEQSYKKAGISLMTQIRKQN